MICENLKMFKNPIVKHGDFILQWETTVVIVLLMLLFTEKVVNASTADTDLYFVSVDGKDDRSLKRGSENKPFRTLEYALNRVEPKGAVVIRAGVYHEQIRRKNLTDVSIITYPGERVIFDGTVAVESIANGDWEKVTESVFRRKVDRDVWQLFVDGKQLVNARWPNASFSDGSVFSAKGWALADPEYSVNGSALNDPEVMDLAKSGLNIENAILIANFGGWETWTRRVTEHQDGSNHFKFDKVPHFKNKPWNPLNYFVEGKLQFLDKKDEWFFDAKEKFIYVFATEVPKENYFGKVQSYAIDGENWRNVTVAGLNFFATTMKCERCDNLVLTDMNFHYASASKRPLGLQSTVADLTRFTSSKKSSGLILSNCNINNTDSQALIIEANRALIENCLFYNIDYAVSESYVHGESVHLKGDGNVFKSNTIYSAGASSALSGSGWFVAELNHIYNTGFAQSDGAMIHVRIPSQTGAIVRYNWCHDSPDKYGIRFDSPIPPTRWGHGGTIHHNVVWNAKGINVKGERHKVFHNLAFDNQGSDIRILDDTKLNGGGNKGTKTQNNVADSISGERNRQSLVPGISVTNYSHPIFDQSIKDQLTNADDQDFRPIRGSKLVSAGQSILELSGNSSGIPVDLGPYQNGVARYWIPGRRLIKASMPIPRDTGSFAPDNALIWQTGFGAIEHHLYFGPDRAGVKNADKTNQEFQGIFLRENVYRLEKLQEKVYFWRVDAVIGDRVVKGDVWSVEKTGV